MTKILEGQDAKKAENASKTSDGQPVPTETGKPTFLKTVGYGMAFATRGYGGSYR